MRSSWVSAPRFFGDVGELVEEDELRQEGEEKEKELRIEQVREQALSVGGQQRRTSAVVRASNDAAYAAFEEAGHAQIYE
jgi:hypothetical protein